MATGACGIQCDACALHARGICSTCGPGTSPEAARKLEAQVRLLGGPCPILACAVERGVDHCPRDCEEFPCGIFASSPYPYSSGYLDMHRRRRAEPPPDRTPSGEHVEVPGEYWDQLLTRNIPVICSNSGAREHPEGILLPFLKEYLLLDIESRALQHQEHTQWKRSLDPLLELICLLYLLHASPAREKGKLAGARELKNGHFFTGPHELDTRPLLEVFARDGSAFHKAARRLEGEAVDLADISYRFQVFPKVPVFLLLWEEDGEFPARLTPLFDSSIEEHLAADAIWGLFNLLTKRLLLEARAGRN